MSLNRNIFKDSLIVTGIGLVNSAVGFLVPVLIAMKFGATVVTDAYYLAILIPFFFIGIIIGGGIRLVFIPILVEEQARDSKVGEDIVRGSAMLLFLLSLVIVLIVAVAIWMGLFQFTGDPRTARMSSQLCFELLPLITLAILHNLYMAAYQAQQKFAIAELTQGLHSIVQIPLIFLLARFFGIHTAVMGHIIGRSIALLLMMRLVRRELGINPMPKFTVVPGLQKMLVLSLVALAGFVFARLTSAASRIIAGFLTEGSVTVFTMAERLLLIPGLVIGGSFGTVLTSYWAKEFAGQSDYTVRNSFVRTLSVMIMIILPMAVSLFLLRQPIVNIIYYRGELSSETAHHVADVFAIFALQMIPMYLHNVIVRILHAKKAMTELLFLSLLSLVVNISLMILFIFYLDLGVVGIAWANLVGSSCVFLATAIVVQSYYKIFAFGALVTQGIKSLIATFSLSCLVYWGRILFTELNNWGSFLLILTFAIGGSIFYGFLLKLMRHKELSSVINLMKTNIEHRFLNR